MKFGICTTVENSQAVKTAGWDFVEERVDQLLQGQLAEAEWKGADRAKIQRCRSPLRMFSSPPPSKSPAPTRT